jgi:hypothetical protein
MFNYSGISGDLTEVMDVDFSETTQADYAFCNWTLVTKLGVIDFRAVTTAGWCFWNMSALKKIVEFYPPNIAIEFSACKALEEINVMSPITQKFAIASTQVLNTASIVSVIEHLSDSTTGKTATFSQTAVNNMTFPHTSTQSGVTYNSWDELIATKQNWTISLSA